MSVTLKEKLLAVKLSSFKFSSFQRFVSQDDDGKKFSYLEFNLIDPLARVYSSTTLYDPATGQRANESKDDVMKVKCNLDLINEEEFIFGETPEGNIDPANCIGSYNGDLFLDLSKAGDVWLTDTKFSKFKADKFSNERKSRLQRALAKEKLS